MSTPPVTGPVAPPAAKAAEQRFDPALLATGSGVLGRLFRLPRAARLAAYAIGTRAWVALAMVVGTYWHRPHLDSWAGHVGNLFYKQLPIRLLDVWGRWDTDFYVAIANEGYPGPDPNGGWIYNAAFFPLFPSLMRGLSVLLGGASVYLCGVFLANTMVALAIIYFDKLVRLDQTPVLSELGVICLLAYPGSHFLSCVYPESTALFLGVFAVYCARKRLLLPCGLACGLAAVTRSNGAVICLPVLYELCRGDDGRLRPTWRVWIFVFPLLTVAFHLGQNWLLYRDPLYFIHVQAGWGRHPSFPLEPLIKFDLTLDYHLFTLGAVLLLVAMFRRRERGGYTAMATVNVMLPLSTGILRGIHRYMASNFPLFFTLADLLEGRRAWRRAYLGVGLTVLTFFAFKWGQGYHPN